MIGIGRRFFESYRIRHQAPLTIFSTSNFADIIGILLPEFDAVSAVLKKVRSLIDVIDKRN